MNALLPMFYVALGGAIGSVLRFKTVGAVMQQLVIGVFPIGTFVVNLLGCFLIGILAGVGERFSWLTDDVRLLLITGVLGGFTTFSAFGLETFNLFRRGEILTAAAYVTLSTLLGLLCVGIGFAAIMNRWR